MPVAFVDESKARELLRNAMNDLWQSDRRPILGSRLKATILNYATRENLEFSEKALGYASFAAFLAQSGVAAVRIREGTDLLAAPIEEAKILEGPQVLQERSRRPLYVRLEFWKAFAGFPMDHQIRAYDPVNDRIVVQPPDVIPEDAILIEPVSREVQLEWRKEFVTSLGPKSPLAPLQDALDQASGFQRFARTLSAYPEIRGMWNRFWSERVKKAIRGWAEQHGIPEERWLQQRQEAAREESRARLYSLLDQIPLEYLLDLKIPLRWLLRREPSDK